jgi:sugar phosphate isomerase/epimerase
MYLGYNTNGFAHHDVFAAVELLAEIGYGGVAITIDHGALNPYDSRCPDHVSRMRDLLAKHRLRSVIETGARYLLDARVKHEPTFMTADESARQRRVDFLRRAIDIARQLRSDCVSLWSGVLREPLEEDAAYARLAAALRPVLEYAAEREVAIGFEPEPGMFIARMRHFEHLLDALDAPNLQLTLDLGHLHCQGEVPIDDVLREWQGKLVNVHIEDMVRGVHEHRQFGEGEMDFPPILATLEEIGYSGGVQVELSRHSHDAPRAALRAFQFLQLTGRWPAEERPDAEFFT